MICSRVCAVIRRLHDDRVVQHAQRYHLVDDGEDMAVGILDAVEVIVQQSPPPPHTFQHDIARGVNPQQRLLDSQHAQAF